MTFLQLMLEFEKRHQDSTIRSSTKQLGALLCDGLREFGTTGKICDRAETLMSVTNSIEVTNYDIDEYQIVLLGDGHILSTYKLSERRGELLRLILKSSVWKLVDTKWRMLFQQGTNQAE